MICFITFSFYFCCALYHNIIELSMVCRKIFIKNKFEIILVLLLTIYIIYDKIEVSKGYEKYTNKLKGIRK